ncbi:MAG TPA: hypothetical protein VGZ25_04225 [Gemmataceae bacterium]|nr:hypothetical protein [Gemmataceae bacterium]
MNRAEDLYTRLKKRPFEPFRVTLKNGRSYDIRFPELNMVGKASMSIGIPEPNNPDPFAERIITVPLESITDVETLPDDPSAIKWQPVEY